MNAMFFRRRVSPAIALRLAAGVVPSLLAIGLLLGLLYYGKYGREIPPSVLVIAAALTLVSVVIAWANAMYFAGRLARLAQSTRKVSGSSERTDEFDRIERAVGKLGSALTVAKEERARSDALAAARLREQGTMLAGVARDAIAQLDQVRLPLQILLASPFGELNENQEELLRDARAAADAIDVALRQLGQVADIDRDALPIQRELVQVNDVIRAVLPVARVVAERHGARTEAVLEPGLPRVLADRARLAEALALVVDDSASRTDASMTLRISTTRAGANALIRISPPAASLNAAPLILATRLIGAQGGRIGVEDGALTLTLGDS